MLISAYAKLASKALDNANEARLQKLADSGNKRASLVIALNDDPIKLHDVTHALITACVCASGVFVSRYLLIPLESYRLSVAVTLLVYLILRLVFCVYLP